MSLQGEKAGADRAAARKSAVEEHRASRDFTPDERQTSADSGQSRLSITNPKFFERADSGAIVLYEPQFKVGSQDKVCVRVFHFTTFGQLRDVSVTHTKAEWVVFVDGQPIATERHSPWSVFKTKSMSMHFNIGLPHFDMPPEPSSPTLAAGILHRDPSSGHLGGGGGGGVVSQSLGLLGAGSAAQVPPGGAYVRGILQMDWHSGGPYWSYELVVNNVHIRAVWERRGGPQKVKIPEVVGPAPKTASALVAPGPLAIEAPNQDVLALLADISTADASSTMMESTLGRLPDGPTGLPVALFPMQPADRTFVVFEVSQNPQGAMLRCCESITEKPQQLVDSRAMIPTNPIV